MNTTIEIRMHGAATLTEVEQRRVADAALREARRQAGNAVASVCIVQKLDGYNVTEAGSPS